MDDESKQMHVDSLNVQVFNHQSLKDSLPVIEHAGSSGKGFPYAPEDFPSPGDVWTWRVGKRHTHAGFWQDRTVCPPDRLQSSMDNKISFRGRPSLGEYIRKTFPDADVDAFFASFVWKIPCTNVAKESLKAIKSNGCSESAAIVQPGDCKASNEMCLIKAKKGSALTPATCNICCSEPNFCRNCCCILCSKTIDWIYDGYSVIKCEALVDEKFICGHVAHIECALRAYLAGKVGGSIDLDAQYYCRCCDNKTDLLLHVQKIIKVSESIGNRDDMVKVLNLGFCMLRGSEMERAEKLRNHIATSIERLKHGVLSEDTWRKRSEISELEQDKMVKKRDIFEVMESTDRPRSSSRHRGSSRDYERHSDHRRDHRDRREKDHSSRDKPRSRSQSSAKDSTKSSSRGDDVQQHNVVKAPSSMPTSTQVVTTTVTSKALQRPSRPSSSSPADMALQAESTARMAQLQKDFSDVCFDGFIFAPTLKRIPLNIQQMTIDCVTDVHKQYNDWIKTAEEISKVSKDRAREIEKLEAFEAKSKQIINSLTSEIDISQRSQTEADNRADKAIKDLEDEKSRHLKEVETLHHRNHELLKERDAAVKIAEELKATQERELKEKSEALQLRDEAQKDAQEACDRLMVALTDKEAAVAERDAALEKAKNVDLLIKEAEERVRIEMKARMDSMLVRYNANILRHRDLSWLDEDYPYQLTRAWDYLVDEEKDNQGVDNIDLALLESKVLRGDEPDILHSTQLSLQQEMGEHSGASPSGPTTDTTAIPAYDSDQAQLDLPSNLSPILEKGVEGTPAHQGTTPAEGITQPALLPPPAPQPAILATITESTTVTLLPVPQTTQDLVNFEWTDEMVDAFLADKDETNLTIPAGDDILITGTSELVPDLSMRELVEKQKEDVKAAAEIKHEKDTAEASDPKDKDISTGETQVTPSKSSRKGKKEKERNRGDESATEISPSSDRKKRKKKSSS